MPAARSAREPSAHTCVHSHAEAGTEVFCRAGPFSHDASTFRARRVETTARAAPGDAIFPARRDTTVFDDARRRESRNRWRWSGLLVVGPGIWGPAQAWACGALNPGESLAPGQAVTTCNGRGQLIHQGDGNVVFYDEAGALWATGTNGSATSTLSMQHDGHLVLYGPGDSPLWHTQTHGNPGAWLAVQDDCNLVI